MLNWLDLILLESHELARLDIAAVHLACAVGLPQARGIDFNGCLRKIDEWAGIAKRWIDAAYREFYLPNPAQYDHSEPLFRAVSLASVLQRHCGLKYNPAKIDPTAPFGFAEHFLPGLTHGAGGTCATIPVAFTAVGRRLGYPIKLAKTKQHLYCRWDDGSAAFNLEVTNQGVDTFPDDHYRKWPLPVSPGEEEHCGYLRSLTPKRELAGFVADRAFIQRDRKAFAESFKTFLAAMTIDIRYEGPVRAGTLKQYNSYKVCLAGVIHEWEAHLKTLYPPGFPKLELIHDTSRRRFKSIPWELERGFSVLESAERLLNDPFHAEAMWEPLRRGRRPRREVPVSVTIDRTRDRYV